MAKEEKPLEYERRTIDTKTLAQRLVLAYQGRTHWLRAMRIRLAYALPLAVAIALVPFLAGIGGSKKVFTNGRISTPHAIFEGDCKQCHAVSFGKVRDQDCKTCHDGPRHQTTTLSEPRCAECHIEHKGKDQLAAVSDASCTQCHSNLSVQGKNIVTKAARVTHFSKGKHPDFSGLDHKDDRPLHLNHALHMPAQPKNIRGVKLPMSCTDCHGFDAAGSAVPVSFEKHCRSCHKGELGFDVYQVLGADAGIAPHSKDPKSIQNFIRDAYTHAVESNPALTQKPLGRNLDSGAPRNLWLETVIRDSASYVLEKKCQYCHELKMENGLPVIEKVNRVAGRFIAGKAEGPRWLEHGEFRHHPHRMVACQSCHSKAAQSQKTSDVLIPSMESCLPCHGNSGTSLDNCSQCHSYHDKASEKEIERKTIQQLIGHLQHSSSKNWRRQR